MAGTTVALYFPGAGTIDMTFQDGGSILLQAHGSCTRSSQIQAMSSTLPMETFIAISSCPILPPDPLRLIRTETLAPGWTPQSLQKSEPARSIARG